VELPSVEGALAREESDTIGEGNGVAQAQSTPNGTLTQQELESRLWAAANSLRGPVDPADFKAYIFPLLFFRRVSDTWDDEHDRALADFNGQLTTEIEADYHRFQIPDGCHWRDLRRLTENVGVGLQNILDRVQQANPDTLAGIFGDVGWGNKEKLPEHALLNLIESFNTLDLRPSHVGHDVLGNAYEYLLREFADASGKKAGEFFTPRPVVRLLTRILDPQPTDSVYDPAVGSGGMLVEAANEVIEAGGSVRQMRFAGQEVNLTTSAIARMNLFLHDIEDARIRRGDTLRDPRFLDVAGRLDRFDLVIANPPFSLKNWGADVWARDPWSRAACGTPPPSFGDYAWVQHMVASMKPVTGRVGVVMPHGVLFRGGAEGQIRSCLVRSDQLEAVIGLAPNIFYSTSIPACLLIFRATKPTARRGHVLYIDGSRCFEKGRSQNRLRDEDVDAILAAYRTGDDPDGEGGVAVRLVPHLEIEANGWDLNIGRYVKGAAAEVVDVATALAELAEAQRALHEAEAGLAERLREAGYG
jgi:type I restriction enzyme M protein